MGKINFNSPQAKSKIKRITELVKKPMTSREIAVEMGISLAGLRLYVVHLREAGALIEVGRVSIKAGGVHVQYQGTGQYHPVASNEAEAFAVTSSVKPFRDALCVAFFGPARISG